MKAARRRLIAVVTGLFCASVLNASVLVDVSAVTDKIIMCHFDDGSVNYRSLATGLNDTYTNNPLNTTNADRTNSYPITSPDDPCYTDGRYPLKVGRKTKSTEFPNWPWVYVKEHWICLELPYAMQRGKTYRVNTGSLATNVFYGDMVFDDFNNRNEAIHLNQIGYVPSARMKYGYISQWIGGTTGDVNNLWRLELDSYSGTAFHLVDANTGTIVFSGTISKRKDFETGSADVMYTGDPEPSNYNQCDVWQADFSSFQTPGEYRLVVEHLGCSYPFKIANDVYAGAFYVTARGLYHHRSGPARGQPWTNWPKPIDHYPGVNDFNVFYTTWSYMHQGEGIGQMNLAPYLTTWGMPANPQPWMGTNWGWGGWFDAGDWDRNSNHIFGSQQLLLVYELAANKFYDGQLNIPESGNHVPDIIDEARWTIDFFGRLTGPTGGVSGGIECITPTAPDGSWRDRNKTWYAYKEEPRCTILTAAACAQLAYCLELAGDTGEKAALISEAQGFYNWATNPANLQPGDAAAIRDHRMLAAAWLYKITGDVNYQNQYKTDNMVTTNTTPLASSGSYDQQMAVWTYITTNQPTIDTTLKNKQIQATYNWAATIGTTPAASRSFRMGGNHWQPTVVGAIVTTPQVLPLIVAYHVSGNLNYLDYVYTSCDYTLGGNALNMTWITGAGLYGAEKAPLHSLNHDAYTDGVVPIIPGIVNYGPLNLGFSAGGGSGPWAAEFVYLSFWPTADPDIKPYRFPTHELYTDNPYTIMNNEYTVWQNIAPAAAAYGYLWAINSDPGDLDDDNEVNLADFAALANDWVRTDCDYDNGFCGKADLNLDGNVDLRDIGSFCGLFLR